MKHICVPNSFDLTWGYSGLNYEAYSCSEPLDTQTYENIISACEAATHDFSSFTSSTGRKAQFWTVDLELDENGKPILGSEFTLKWRYKCS